MISQISSFISEQGASALAKVLGNDAWIVRVLSSHPLVIPLIILFVLIIIFGISLFVDFIKDSWKMPIGIVLDMIAVALFTLDPWWLLLFAFISGAAFFIMSLGQNFGRWVYTIIGFLKFFILLPLIPIPEEIKVLAVFIPVCSIAMFFVCVTD